MLTNLISNAYRYGRPNGHIWVSLRRDGQQIRLSVKDDGIGIDEENQSRIFERFYRVNKSRSRETGGTGLGLSIVKHVAELYGAKLTLSSTLGAGTEITVSFKK